LYSYWPKALNADRKRAAAMDIENLLLFMEIGRSSRFSSIGSTAEFDSSETPRVHPLLEQLESLKD